MNENIDLTKILKNCPKGWKLWSPIFGKIEFYSIVEKAHYPIMLSCKKGIIWFSKEGLFDIENEGAECVLFPSKGQRDWSKFTAPWYNKELIKPKFKVGDRIRHKETNKDDVYEISKVYDDSYGIVGFNWGIYMKYQDQYELVPNKFDPKTLKPFDRVLVRHECYHRWRCEFYSYIRDDNGDYPYIAIGGAYKRCIPYNEETKHLIGTTDEAPEYYRYWED